MLTLKDLFITGKKKEKWQTDLMRRTEAAKYLDFYNNEQYLHTIDHLQGIYPNTIDQLKRYAKVEYVTSKMLDIMSLMFQGDPAIEVEGLSEAQMQSLNDLIDRTGLISKLDTVQKLNNNYLTVAVFPKWDDKRKETYLEIITPDDMVVLQDPDRPTHIEAVLVNYGIVENDPFKADAINKYLYISDTEWVEVEVDEKTGTMNRKQEKPNPYKRIPLVFFTLHPPLRTFWGEKKNDIVDANLTINEYATNIAVMIHYQSFSTLVRTGESGWLSEHPIKFGPQFSLDLGVDPLAGENRADAKYITPDAKIEQVEKVMNNKIIALASSHGISANAYRSDNTQARSGYSIRLDRSDLINRNIQQQSHYYRPMQQLIQMLMATEQISESGARYGDIDSIYKSKVNIKFADITIDEDPVILVEIRSKQIANGTKSAIDFIKEDNPELTDDEARQKYEENMAIKQGQTPADDTELDRIIQGDTNAGI